MTLQRDSKFSVTLSYTLTSCTGWQPSCLSNVLSLLVQCTIAANDIRKTMTSLWKSRDMYLMVDWVKKLVTTPVHAGAGLLTSHNAPQLRTGSRGAFWGWRAGQRADQLTSFGVSETELRCSMSGGDMWLTTWPRCLTHWSERERERKGERGREREKGQAVQPFAHQWRVSPPLNTAYWSAQPAGPLLCVHFLLIISSLFLLTALASF